jgi:hypothetical protein
LAAYLVLLGADLALLDDVLALEDAAVLVVDHVQVLLERERLALLLVHPPLRRNQRHRRAQALRHLRQHAAHLLRLHGREVRRALRDALGREEHVRPKAAAAMRESVSSSRDQREGMITR